MEQNSGWNRHQNVTGDRDSWNLTNFTVHAVLEKLAGFQVDKKIHAFMKLEGSPF
jgi:hypothetical protein